MPSPAAPVLFRGIAIRRDEASLDDVARATDDALATSGVVLPAGGEVAIAVGSRGIHDLVTVVRRVVAWVRAGGAIPFVVPAMGSHGGATAAGQLEVLASSGITPSAIGCEVRSSMDVVPVPAGACPVPVVTDGHAASAAATIVVNRVKPHTDFHAEYESGLVKMLAIGLGKQVQAESIHAHGTRGLRELLPLVARQVLEHGNVVLGMAIVETSTGGTCTIDAVPAALILDVEPGLLARARAHVAQLPVEDLDVLVVDRMGKDISGVGLDPAVIGRRAIPGEPDPATPRIRAISCHGLTPASHGNATGIGLVDVVTRRLFDAVDLDVTRTNVATSGFLRRGAIPIVVPRDVDAWELARRAAGMADSAAVRAARIRDTSSCARLWVTEAVVAELAARADVEVVAGPRPLVDARGRLLPFDLIGDGPS